METMALRQALLNRLGHFPQRVPLTPTVGSRTDEGVYTRALVTYNVEAGERVSAWLLMPQGAAPTNGWPAILAIHQHDNNYDLGKTEPAGLAGNAMYAYGQEVCQRGYVVLCPDLLCFEERRPTRKVRQANIMDDAGYERFEFTKCLLAGSCLQTKYLHDLTCAVDLLVIPSRSQSGAPGSDRALVRRLGSPLARRGMTHVSLRLSLPAALDYYAPWCVMASIMASQCMSLASYTLSGKR